MYVYIKTMFSLLGSTGEQEAYWQTSGRLKVCPARRTAMCVPIRIENNSVNSVLAAQPSVRKHTARRVRKAASAMVAVVALFVLTLAAVGARTIISNFGGAAEPACTVSGGSNGIQANVGSVITSGGYITVTGSVVNKLHRAVPAVNGFLELLDSKGNTIATEQAVVSFSALKPNEASPFSIMANEVKGAVQCRLSFRHADGSAIE
jgi:hypothetical protein